MLRKLMKHELRATGRIMLPVFLLVLVTAFGANLSTRVLLESENNILNIFGLLLLTAFSLAIAAACILAFFLMIQRFYKNLLQDEGYVMMTLPVSVHQHIISKLIVSMLWFVLSAVVVALAIFILVYEVGMVTVFFRGLKSMLEELAIAEYTVDALFFGLELIVLMFFGAAASCLQFYMAMAIGHSFASRKLLNSIVVYFGVQFILQALSGIIMSRLAVNGFPELFVSGVAAIHFVMMVMIILSVISSAIFYFPTTWFLTRRLNLE